MEDLRKAVFLADSSKNTWHLDLRLGEKHCVLIHQEDRDYGLCFKPGNGELTPEETVGTMEEAVNKLHDFFLR